MKNIKDFKNNRAIQAFARTTAFTDLVEMFSTKYGTDKVSIVGNNTIAVALEDIELANGEISEICVEIKPVAKDVDDRKTPNKIIKGYERLNEADAYEFDKKESERKAEETAKRNAEKKRKDFERRAKAKAEKEKAKAEKAKA